MSRKNYCTTIGGGVGVSVGGGVSVSKMIVLSIFLHILLFKCDGQGAVRLAILYTEVLILSVCSLLCNLKV